MTGPSDGDFRELRAEFKALHADVLELSERVKWYTRTTITGILTVLGGAILYIVNSQKAVSSALAVLWWPF